MTRMSGVTQVGRAFHGVVHVSVAASLVAMQLMIAAAGRVGEQDPLLAGEMTDAFDRLSAPILAPAGIPGPDSV